MKIYLASRYSRNAQLRGYRAELETLGHVVTSRWINGDHQIDDAGLSAQAEEAERVRFAMEDWEDLMASDCCISFTEIPRTERTRGGRHVEYGAALATGKRCMVVGHRENVFHCLPQVEFYETWESALHMLTVQPRVKKQCVWGIGTADGIYRCGNDAAFVSTFHGADTKAVWCREHGQRKQPKLPHGIRLIKEVKP